MNANNFNNDTGNSYIGNFANQVNDNARQQTNQYNYTLEQQENATQAAKELQIVLEKLSLDYSTETVTGRMKVATETMNYLEKNDELTGRVMSAIRAGSISAFEQLLSHPASSFVIAALKDWKGLN